MAEFAANPKDTSFQPIVIIGAPRSGTNMLRDALTALPGAATWPCDEINYIWRHGNLRHPSDAFPSELARPAVQAYVRRRFRRLARRYRASHVVEKTCANSLRVPFVDRIVPEARYVFIVRDGRDAVASAVRRWRAKLDPGYVLRKTRFVPPADLPYYALRYGLNRIHRLLSRDGRLSWWGPRLDGMDDLIRRYTLEEFCALQWRECVEAAESALREMDASRWMAVRYEDLVVRPRVHLSEIAVFAGLPATEDDLRRAAAGVSDRHVGKGVRELQGVSEQLLPLWGDTLTAHGYG